MKSRTVIGLLAFVSLVPFTAAMPATGATSCSPSWKVVPTPKVAGNFQGFSDVTMRSPSDVWAIGRRTQGYSRTLAERWDGSRWQVVPTPNGTKEDNFLYGVSASSGSDAWAVGSNLAPDPNLGGASRESVAMHWNGIAWRITPT